MPKLPLAQIGSLQGHERATAPITRLLDSDFGMSGPRALEKLGEKIADAGHGIADAAHGAIRAKAAFDRQMIDTENRIAAIDDRNLFESGQRELETWLADNPMATDQEKQQRIRDADEQYGKARTEIVERMSPSFRRYHDSVMQGVRQQALGRRGNLIMQGAVTRDKTRVLELSAF